MAGGAIRGITVEIGGDTTKLGKAIESSEKSAKSLQTELKQIDKMLKFDPSNVELLNQRQKVLADSIAETSAKLNILKEAEAQVVAQFERGEIAEDQLRAFQREIMQTESKLNGMRSKLSDTEDAIRKLADGMDDADKEADDMGDSLDESGKHAEDASGGFTVMKGAIADLIAEGFLKLAEVAKDTLTEILIDSEQALDRFQAKTGVATDAMDEFEEQIKELYNNNFGESIEDIANSMAQVKQITGEIDPSKLKDLTQHALVLRDTFDFDVTESIRAVNMLMDQFGITGEEAFNLIVQGAQNGLDKNGDLLDSINEYAVHYQQLGYDANEFFNSLANGTEAGTFSVDKLGDAMKEFGIRVKDTAESTTEGFELVGLNADQMRKAFAEGGKSARDATAKTLKALFEMDDKVKQNQAGVALFGTMWEDLGAEGVKALMNTTGELNKTKDTMNEITEISYDNIGSKFEQIGRTVKSDLIAPLAQKLLPTIEKVVDYCINNGEKVINIIKTIAFVLGTVFVINKIATFIESIKTMVATFSKLKTTLQSATVAQYGLNTAQSSSPWGLLAVAISTVIAGLITYCATSEKSETKTSKFCDKLAEHNKLVAESKEEYDRLIEAQREENEAISSQFNYYESLVDELADITDENGNVVKGYEARAEVITGILSDALGEEIKTDQLVADGKQKVIDKIEKLIFFKRAEALLDANQDEYTKAISEKEQALQRYMTAQENYTKLAKEFTELNNEIAKKQKEIDEESDFGARARKMRELKDLKDELDELSGTVEETEQAYTDAKTEYEGYIRTIENYDGLSSAIIKGDADEIERAMSKLTNNFISAENGTEQSLKNQIKIAEENLANLKTAYEQGIPGVSQEMIDQAQEYLKIVEGEYDRFLVMSGEIPQQATDKFAYGFDVGKGKVATSAGAVATTATTQWSAMPATAYKFGQDSSTQMGSGMSNQSSDVSTSAYQVVQTANGQWSLLPGLSYSTGQDSTGSLSRGLLSASPSVSNGAYTVVKTANGQLQLLPGQANSVGRSATSNVATGMTANKSVVQTAGTTVGNAGKTGLDSVDTSSSGSNFTLGFSGGILNPNALFSLNSTINTLADKALGWLRAGIGEASPAKKVKPSGRNFALGFAVGIENETDTVNDTVGDLAENALKTFNSGVTSKISAIKESVGAITDAIVKETENKTKAFDSALKKIELQKEFGLLTEKQYYNELEYLRDTHLTKHSDKWYEVTKKIYQYNTKLTEDITKDYEKKFKDAFDEIEDYATDIIEDLADKQEDMKDKLTEFGDLTTTVKINAGDDSLEFLQLADISGQTEELQKYADLLTQVKERGNIPPVLFDTLRDMSIDEGTAFAEALMNATDEEFNNYIANWQAKQDLADKISKDLYQDEADEVANEIKSMFEDVETEFTAIGENSAEEFETGFMGSLRDMLSTVKSTIRDKLSSVLNSIGSASVSVSLGGDIPQMGTGGIIDRPTVVQVGEDGTEAIVPLEKNTGWIDRLANKINGRAVPSKIVLNNDGLADKLDRIYDRLNRLQIVLNSGALVGEILDDIDSGLADKQILSSRGV